MSTKKTLTPHLLIALQMFVLAGYAIYSTVQAGLAWLAPALVFGVWAVSVGVMSICYSMWPDRFPRLKAKAKAAWKLRLPQVNATAEKLRQIGFEEIGVKEERTFLIGLQTRELWHPVHRTFASLTTSAAALFVPRVTFITRGDDGRIVYTGYAVVHRRRHLVARAGVGTTVEERFEDHLRALKGEELVLPAPPEAESHDYRELGAVSHDALMQARLELCREWYVVSFASDEKYDEWRKATPVFAS